MLVTLILMIALVAVEQLVFKLRAWRLNKREAAATQDRLRAAQEYYKQLSNDAAARKSEDRAIKLSVLAEAFADQWAASIERGVRFEEPRP